MLCIYSDESGGGCFSLDMMVLTLTGEKKFDQLKVGDKILTVGAEHQLVFSEFFAALDQGHRRTVFLQLHTASGQILELTHHHIIFTRQHPSGVKARQVVIGDQVWVRSNDHLVLSNITKIGHITKRGWLNPGTMDGTLLVNNIWASAYANEWAGHGLIHKLFSPLRALYKLAKWFQPSIQIENSSDQKVSQHWYVMLLKFLGEFAPVSFYRIFGVA